MIIRYQSDRYAIKIRVSMNNAIQNDNQTFSGWQFTLGIAMEGFPGYTFEGEVTDAERGIILFSMKDDYGSTMALSPGKGKMELEGFDGNYLYTFFQDDLTVIADKASLNEDDGDCQQPT